MKRLAVLAAILLTGCGNNTERPGDFNKADVMFLQMMVQHHDQGVRIARTAQARPLRPQVRTLAKAIESTQAQEITTMTGWLHAWRHPLTANAHEHAAHGGMPQTSETAIAALRRSGDEHRFLNTLIAHQDDAVQLARQEIATGRNSQVKELAIRIDRSRTAQVQQMLAWLAAKK
jgi:uncharacterized protein (DUF305 family)